MNVQQLADMMEKIVSMKVATQAGYQSRANECKKFVVEILKAAGVVVKP